jgi:hypothetical protein
MINRASCLVLRASSFMMSLAFLTALPPDRLTAQAPLEDNSFLIEEAYNQEDRVVQHISTAELFHGATAFSFTQEWPAGGQTSQLSYTIVAVQDQGFRFGDALINYRYQAVGKEGAHLWVAPRLSALVPVGDANKLGGNGGWGLDGVIPVSWEVGKRLSLHGNLGGTWRPSAENGAGARAGTFEPFIGGSAIFFVTPMLNLMVESVWRDGRTVVADGVTTSGWDQALTYGVRYGINFPNGLQVVPGVARMPAVGDAATRSFIYLSFEHKF